MATARRAAATHPRLMVLRGGRAVVPGVVRLPARPGRVQARPVVALARPVGAGIPLLRAGVLRAAVTGLPVAVRHGAAR
jgi:hypothetical protein